MRAIHPGEILRDELKELGLSMNIFAKAIHVPTNRISEIIKGQRRLTADTAIRLACFFDMTPEFWMNLQMAYDLKQEMKAHGKKIKREVVIIRFEERFA